MIHPSLIFLSIRLIDVKMVAAINCLQKVVFVCDSFGWLE